MSYILEHFPNWPKQYYCFYLFIWWILNVNTNANINWTYHTLSSQCIFSNSLFLSRCIIVVFSQNTGTLSCSRKIDKMISLGLSRFGMFSFSVTLCCGLCCLREASRDRPICYLFSIWWLLLLQSLWVNNVRSNAQFLGYVYINGTYCIATR